MLGNHDDDRVVPAALAAAGFAVLRDQRTRVAIRGESVDIAGLRYWTRRLRRHRQGGARRRSDDHHAGARSAAAAEAAALDVQLVLAGHTHGGQVVLPGIGAVAARRFPVIAGQGSEGNCTVYVSRGVGTVFVPVRINCPPEVSVLTLRLAQRREFMTLSAVDEAPAVDAPAAGEDTRATASGSSAVLLDQDARRERLGRVVWKHRHGRLPHDRPGVELRRHEVHGAAGHLHAVGQRLAGASTPGKAGSSDGWTFSTGPGKRVEEAWR